MAVEREVRRLGLELANPPGTFPFKSIPLDAGGGSGFARFLRFFCSVGTPCRTAFPGPSLLDGPDGPSYDGSELAGRRGTEAGPHCPAWATSIRVTG